MPRNRVLSFMSQWGGAPRSPTAEDFKEAPPRHKSTPPPRDPPPNEKHQPRLNVDTHTPQSVRGYRADALGQASPHSPSTQSRARAESRANTRPNSMIQTYNPPQMELAIDTPPELAPIFSYLNSHSNKLYQEGYFLKLHDLDSSGRPSRDRTWTECFAQLVGTVLSLWDAAALDAAGEDGEVVPTFINLSDASIKMIESLPMNGAATGGSLQNVLSVSTAANNRYLLHFNSLSSLTQWTAGIRLAMFEHSTLQEAYTGSLIAGKGRYLNGIKQIMERTRFAYDDWARVRFGAGTPWRRCWCVISPPDEKEWQKSQKSLKKGSAYSRAPLPKGDIKFYDTRKVTKKTKPIATISDAYAAYAIYPQSKPLVEQSTLVKLEGLVTIHGVQETTTEGFVFVMPEVHAAVSGFEMMLRWLFPVYDTFGLYGRPTRLIADTLDARGLMFAMPKDRRYGYLDILDVSGLIHEKGSQNWSERQWRKELRKLTSTRMTTALENGERSAVGSRRNTMSRNSLPPTRNGVQFREQAAIHSTPGSRSASPHKLASGPGLPFSRTDSAPQMTANGSPHKRSVSDAPGYRKYMSETPSRLSHEQSGREDEQPPTPPRHGEILASQSPSPIDRVNSDDRLSTQSPYEQVAAAASPYLPPPEPVVSPPELQHNPHSRPAAQPHVAPELRRAHSNVDEDTLQEMHDAVRNTEQDTFAGVQAQEQNFSYRDQHQVAADRTQGYCPNGYGREMNRLESIPQSPYHAADGDYFQASDRPSIEAVAAMNGQRPGLSHDRSSQSISRKPLPTRQLPQVPQDGESAARSGQQVRDDVDSPASPTSPTGSLLFDPTIVDEDLIARVLNDDSDRTNTIASTETPDYASSGRSSLEEQKRKEQQEKKEFERRGKLKTVGDPSMTTVPERGYGAGKLDTWAKDQEALQSEIPTIEFGPTYSYKVGSRPGTSGTLTPGDMSKHGRSKSRDGLREGSSSRMNTYFDASQGSPVQQRSPHEKRRSSYFGARTPTPTGIEAPEVQEPVSRRTSMAWAPGVASVGSPQPGLSPEEYVKLKYEQSQRPQYAPQPRYAQSRRSLVPLIAHGRNASTNDLPQMRRSSAKTPPPFQRSISGDWTVQRAESPQTPPSRPQSRNLLRRNSGATLLNGTQPVTLSAKERTQVSRMTGAPLVNMAVNDEKRTAFETPTGGLVGALADRERERAMVDRFRSGAVQGAVATTYQQQMEAQQVAILAQQQKQQEARYAAQKAAQTAQFNQMAHERAQRMLAPQERSSMYMSQQFAVQQHAPAPSQYRQSWAPDMMQQQLLQQQMQLQQMQQMQRQNFAVQQPWGSVDGGQYAQQSNFAPQQQQPYGNQQQQYYQPRR